MSHSLRGILGANRKNSHRTLLHWEGGQDISARLEELLATWPTEKPPKALLCHSVKTRLNVEEIAKRVSKLVLHSFGKSLTAKVLGKTYDLLILHDFQCLTANLLCQLVGVVRGGGAIVLVLPCKLQELHSVKMMAHRRWRPTTGLFNLRLSKLLAGYNPVAECPGPPCTKSTGYSHLIPDLDDGTLGDVLSRCKTEDQAKGLLKILDVLCSDQKDSLTTIVSGDRGRGKSALLGLAAGAFLLLQERTKQPWPCELLFTGISLPRECFHFAQELCKAHFTVETRGDDLIVVSEDKRCRIHYVHPRQTLGCQKSTMVFLDEASSLPATLTEKILTSGFHRLVVGGTCVGYEGSAKSFQMKQLAKLGSAPTEVVLRSPIRFNIGDPVEKFLNTLLCLEPDEQVSISYPPLDDTELFVVDKKWLFTNGDDRLLRQVFSLLNSAHYKSSPNDLQLVADCDRHSIAILAAGETNPKVCVVLHLAQEGPVEDVKNAGDLGPCTLYDQFADEFWLQAPALRIVRIATHPKCQGLGYGTRALQLLSERVCVKLDRQNDGPLQKLSAVHFNPPPVYLCVSFGLTERLAHFWLNAKYRPLYVRSGCCPLTGEHSCIMIKPIYEDGHADWLKKYTADFVQRFVFQLRQDSLRLLPVRMCQQLLCQDAEATPPTPAAKLSPFQAKRLASYCSDLADHNIILDLMPLLASAACIPSFSNIQQAILIGMGSQGKTIFHVGKELQMPIAQVRALLNRALRQVLKELKLPVHACGLYEARSEEDEINRKRRVVADLDDVL